MPPLRCLSAPAPWRAAPERCLPKQTGRSPGLRRDARPPAIVRLLPTVLRVACFDRTGLGTELGTCLRVATCRPKWPAPAGALPTGAVFFSPTTQPPSRAFRNSAKGPVSRILSCAVIPLGAALPRTLISDLPGGFGNSSKPPERIGPMRSPAWLLAEASLPIWSCSVWGLPCPRLHSRSGALLPHHFTLTAALRQQAASGMPSAASEEAERGSRGGIFSVALAVHGP